MAIFKCKMCGGTLDVAENMTVCQCEYCGAKQTLPRGGSDITNNLFNRANNLRMKCEYDKAQEIYEKIVSSGAEDAEAYWGLVLCKYGIEYVEDPETFNKIPTCHRTQLESVLTDIDYQAALEHADSAQKDLYMAEAKEIDRLQKNILDIVHTEKPFDVFICYKESDENGRRTQDSVIANEIYHQLTQEGFKVFYAAITLEDKLGQAYEPYIFAALNSARIMLAIGTKPEYFNAVWVKNEWSRYLKIIKNDRKKLLIPCYKDMDAYDLPEEFSHLQAQDMSKIGFMNDVIRGIRKVLNAEEKPAAVVRETVFTSGSSNIAPLLKRVFIFLEDGDWANANSYCEKVLDLDPECAQAYFGKLLAKLHVPDINSALKRGIGFSNMDNYKKAYRFADDAFKKELSGYVEQSVYNSKKQMYDDALRMLENACDENTVLIARKRFEGLGDFLDSAQKVEECYDKQKEFIYERSVRKMETAKDEDSFRQAEELFRQIGDFRDAVQKAAECQDKWKEIKYNQAVMSMNYSKSADDFNMIADMFQMLGDYKDSAQKMEECHAYARYIVDNAIYLNANRLATNITIPALDSAIECYNKIINFKDSRQKIEECRKRIANIKKAGIKKAKIISAITIAALATLVFWTAVEIGTVVSAIVAVVGCIAILKYFIIPNKKYNKAIDLYKCGNYIAARSVFKHLNGFKISSDYIIRCTYVLSEHISDARSKLPRNTISAGFNHTVGLKSDGTVVTTKVNNLDDYEQRNVSKWTNCVAVSAGSSHTVGLKSDGTVVATGSCTYYINFGQCRVSDWTDIVAVSARSWDTVGLKSDGTVVAVGENKYGECDVSSWTDIVAVSAGGTHTVGLKSDGSVVAVGSNEHRQCNVSDWTNIVAVSAGGLHTIGLKSDGSVVAVGWNNQGQCNVSDWKDIVAIGIQ